MTSWGSGVPGLFASHARAFSVAVVTLLVLVLTAGQVSAQTSEPVYSPTTSGDIELLSASAVLGMLQRANAKVPSQLVLDEYQRYMNAWLVSQNAAAAARASKNSKTQPADSSANTMFDSLESSLQSDAQETAAIAQRDRLESDLFAAIESAAPEVARPAVREARARRSLMLALNDPCVALGGGMGLAGCDIEGVVAVSFPDDLAVRSAVEAALLSSRPDRVAAARALAKVIKEGRSAVAAQCKSLGLSSLTWQEFMVLQEANAAQQRLAHPGVEGTMEPIPGSEYARILEALQAIQAVSNRGVPAAHLALIRAQWDAARAAIEALPPELRWSLIRRLPQDPVGFTYSPASGLMIAIMPMLCDSNLPADCRACLREAVERWRKEVPAIYLRMMEDGIRKLKLAVGDAPVNTDPDDQWQTAASEVARTFEAAWESRSEQEVNRCRNKCGTWDQYEAGPRDRKLLADFPEANSDELFDEFEEDSQEEDPFAHINSLTTTGFAGQPIEMESLILMLANLGISSLSQDQLTVIDALLQTYETEWESEVSAAEQSLLAVWSGDQEKKPQPARDARHLLRELFASVDRIDGRFIDSLRIAIGDALNDSDAALLRAARSLGDARTQQPLAFIDADMFGAKQVNPAEVLIAANLSSEHRPVAAAVILARAPNVLSLIDAARLARLSCTEVTNTQEHFEPGTSQTERWRVYQERQAKIANYAAAVFAAERSASDAVQSALHEACVGLSVEEVARVEAITLRRKFPDAHRSDAEIATVALAICERLAPQDVTTREAIAQTADTSREQICASRTSRLKKISAALASANPLDGEKSFERLGEDQSFRALEHFAEAERVLALERLRLVAPVEVREGCPAWRSICGMVGIKAIEPDLHSAP